MSIVKKLENLGVAAMWIWCLVGYFWGMGWIVVNYPWVGVGTIVACFIALVVIAARKGESKPRVDYKVIHREKK